MELGSKVANSKRSQIRDRDAMQSAAIRNFVKDETGHRAYRYEGVNLVNLFPRMCREARKN